MRRRKIRPSERVSTACAWCGAISTDEEACRAPGRRRHYFLTFPPKGRPRKTGPSDEPTSRRPKFVRLDARARVVPIPLCPKCEGRMVYETEDSARCLTCGKIVFSGPVKPEMNVAVA